MIMKYYIYLAMILSATSCALAQPNGTDYKWEATMKVVGEDGNPIGGATADIGYYTNSQPANDLGVTDTNGIFSTSHSVRSTLAEVSLQAAKSGYYPTWRERQLGPQYDLAQWIFTQTLVLKKIEKPIAMYAKQIDSLTFPAFNKPIGYDLMVGDWVAPYGKGINSDIIFTENHVDEKSGYTFTISFPNLGDGIQEFALPESEKGSALRSSHDAPVDGYQPKHEQTQMADPNRNYYFRVRTVLDQNRNVVSAHYGKIYGDFMQFRYYLNPIPNSVNIEFDQKHNLLGGIQPFEQVTAP
jgi:hypothetical protein